MNEHPFTAFIDLIKFDQKTRLYKSDIARFEEEIAELQDQEAALQEGVTEFKRNVTESRKAVDVHELHIKELDAQEKQKKEKLDGVASQREYQAIRREIDRLKVLQNEEEEALMSAWNKLETAQKEYEEHVKQSEEKQQELSKTLAEKIDALDALRIEQLEHLKGREEKEKQVPQEWLEKYNQMSMQVDDPGVPVQHESCSACSYHITNQEMLRLKRRAVVQCKGCFRLLYLPEAMSEAE